LALFLAIIQWVDKWMDEWMDIQDVAEKRNVRIGWTNGWTKHP